jgi:phage gp29-like protein
VLPEGWTLALLSTGGSRQFDTDKIITRYNTQIMMTSLAQFLMLGQNSVGSWALSKDQSDLFVMSVNATCDIIQEALSGQVLPRLMALNGYDTEGLELTHTPAGDADLSTMADTIVKLANIGMITPLPADEVYVRKMLDMPEVDEETLMEERDRKEAQASAIAGAISQASQEKPAQKKQVDEEDITENPEAEENAAVTQYFSSTRPDDMKRRRYYRKYQRELSSIFGKLEKRIKKEMRNA